MSRPHKKSSAVRKPNPAGPAHRRCRKSLRLGPNARCVRCGEEELDALCEAPRRLLERHHYLGDAHDPGRVVSLCANCHRVLSAKQLDDGVPLEPVETCLERLSAMVVALASHQQGIAEAQMEWHDRLQMLVEGLDGYCPDWRTQPWAK